MMKVAGVDVPRAHPSMSARRRQSVVTTFVLPVTLSVMSRDALRYTL